LWCSNGNGGGNMNEHDATELAFKNGYEKGKQEVAREIFEEIERSTIDIKFEQVAFSAIRSTKLDILKQKYTGEKT
jgi:hypothetical protein